MPAKGSIAKENVIKKIAAAFGSDYIGEFDKKYYLWADDGGSRVQISIALTVPKVLRGVEETGELNFEDNTQVPIAQPVKKSVEMTKEEEETLADLMAKFGL